MTLPTPVRRAGSRLRRPTPLDRRPCPGAGPRPVAARSDGRRETLLRLVVLGALTAMGSLSIDMYLPALPELTRDLGSTASQVQLTLTACLLGLGLGQVVLGPLSDRFGRRPPLLGGLVVFALASAVCAAAPSVPVLIVCRLLQGLAGAAGIVIARAVVRDLHAGAAAARTFSVLMLVTGLAPILGPVFGSGMLAATSWRGIFLATAVTGLGLLALTGAGLRETLPVARRRPGGIRATGAAFGRLLGDRVFLGYALAVGLTSGAILAYVSGSTFVLQDIYGASPQVFGLAFGTNAVGLVAASQLNGRLVGRTGPRPLLRAGLLTTATSGLVLLAAVSTGALGVWGVLVPLFGLMSGVGFVMPNAMALALAEHAEITGSGSALLGLFQFGLGAASAPLVGLAGRGTAVPMGLTIAGFTLAALVATAGLTRRRPAPAYGEMALAVSAER
jgi:MFS transporter, DHA1 family, multidrug resistance protein